MSKRTLIILGALVAIVLIFSVRDDGQGAGASSPSPSPQPCRFTVKADILNVRESPTMHAPVVGTFTRGARTGAERTERNGFREIGSNRWVASTYLEPVDGSSC
ncbi:MAG: SH3 domain-containing protein [Sciscionella sp.]